MRWSWNQKPAVHGNQPSGVGGLVDLRPASEQQAEVDELKASVAARDERIANLQDLLARQPWVPKKGISGGAYHSDPGTDSSWDALDQRAEQEACSFRSHPGYKAVLDLLEARLLGIHRRWRAASDASEIATLHIHARVYEDMLATLENKTSLRERKEADARREAKSMQDRERLSSLASAGRSPFLR